MHGNVLTWCQERTIYYPDIKQSDISEDREDALVVVSTDSRVVRGGSFSDQASNLRSAYRSWDRPTFSGNVVGFRVARTLPLGSITVLPPTPEGGRK